MHFFRFFVTPQPKRPFGMLQHVAVLVCSCRVHELPRTRLTATPDLQSILPASIAVVPQHAFLCIGTKLPFNPHSSTRPPQPPAASFKRAYRKCLGSAPRSTDAFLPEAFPIKPSDYTSKWHRVARNPSRIGAGGMIPCYKPTLDRFIYRHLFAMPILANTKRRD